VAVEPYRAACIGEVGVQAGLVVSTGVGVTTGLGPATSVGVGVAAGCALVVAIGFALGAGLAVAEQAARSRPARTMPMREYKDRIQGTPIDSSRG
jgi:hypothetical protein